MVRDEHLRMKDCTLRIIPTCPSCTNGTGWTLWNESIQDGMLKIIPTCPSCTSDTLTVYDWLVH